MSWKTSPTKISSHQFTFIKISFLNKYKPLLSFVIYPPLEILTFTCREKTKTKERGEYIEPYQLGLMGSRNLQRILCLGHLIHHNQYNLYDNINVIICSWMHSHMEVIFWIWHCVLVFPILAHYLICTSYLYKPSNSWD